MVYRKSARRRFAAHARLPLCLSVFQMEYSPFVVDIEKARRTNPLQTCRELGVAVICYSPLGRGILTSSFTNRDAFQGEGDMRAATFPRFSGENFDANTKLVNQFSPIIFAAKKDCTVSQLALAWLLQQGDDIFSHSNIRNKTRHQRT